MMGERMGSEPVGRLLVRFALPVVAGFFIARFYILVDGMFVGQALGMGGMAATAVAMPFVTLLGAIVMVVGDGGAAVLSLRLGKGRLDQAGAVVGNSLVMLAGVSALLGATVLLWAEPLLGLVGASGEVLALAKTYLVISVAGAFSLGFSLGIDTFLRAAGFPNRTLFVQVVAALANIALDYAFVIKLGWGIEGAAGATVLGQVLALVLTMAFLFKRDMPFRLRLTDLRPNAHLMGRIAVLGVPSLIVRGADAVLNLALNAVVVGYGAATVGGDDALAVVGVVSRVTMFVLVPAHGIAVGMRPLIGFNYGAGEGVRVRRLVRLSVVSGIVCLLPLWLVIEVDPSFVISLFGFADAQAAPFAAWALRVAMLAMPLLMVRIVGTNYFQAVGHASTAILLTFFQQIVFMLPFILLAPLVLPLLAQVTALESVFWGMFASDLASTALVAWFLARDPLVRGRLASAV